jgi:hypothetical protein
MNQKLLPNYVSKAERDKEMLEIQKEHYRAPHKGVAPEVTEDTILTFGKYQGKKVKDVPRHYLDYQAMLCRNGGNLYTDNIFDQLRKYTERTR